MSSQDLLEKLKSLFPDAVTEVANEDRHGNVFYTYAIKEEFIDQLKNLEGGG
ncbi:MAG: hypothetical protein ISN29_05345 [Gammaproteobacteria bacterium AqS3]|nr:hypothetical protein [Gammaproteobacteria bacterium AqS3]